MSKDNHHVHILPLKLYLGVGAALLFLTFITVAASYIDLGSFNIVLAMAIAAVKATLVILFFMHLKYDNKLYLFAFVLSIVMLAFLLTITLFDTLQRDLIYPEEAQSINKQAEIYNKVPAGIPEKK